MSITLDDEQTQHIFLTLVESLEGGERLPTKILVTYLQHPENSIRRLAIELLEYGNDPAAIPALLRAAADANVEVSVSASEVLRAFRNPSAVKHLIDGLRHPAPETRLAAVVALRERRAPDAVKGLLRNISDVEPEVRREAVIALAHYRNHDLLPALRSALRDTSPSVRKVTVTAVAEFDGALVFDDLVVALSDENWQVRREAAIALGSFPGQAAEAALRDTLGDSAWQVAREAALSLSRLQAGDDERLAGLLLHEAGGPAHGGGRRFRRVAKSRLDRPASTSSERPGHGSAKIRPSRYRAAGPSKTSNSLFLMETLLLAFFLGAAQAFAGETIRVAIGTQDITINCAAGGPVVRELRLLEKYLPRGGKYKDATYEITWLNLPTGAQLNSEILANRLDIVSMADFPSRLFLRNPAPRNGRKQTMGTF